MPAGLPYNPWIDRLSPYVPGRPLEDLARELGVEPEDIVKLASNENPLGPSPAAVRALRDAAGSMHRYPDGSCYRLRRELAARLRVSGENLVFGCGSNELLVLLAQVYLRPGLNAVMSERSFLIYRLVTELVGAEAIQVPMAGWTVDLSAMAKALNENTRLVFVGNPNNPTGTAVEPDELEGFIDEIPEGVLVIVDEAYVEFMPPSGRPDILARIRAGKPVCSLRTFSKLYGLAGLRIGYAVTVPEVAGLLQRVRQPFNVNAAAQVSALAGLSDDDHVRRTLELVERERAYLQAELARLGLEYVPSCTNFVLVRTGDGGRTFAALQRRRIIVRPMDAYGLPEYVRITVGTREENRRVVEALKELKEGGEKR